VRSGGSPTRSTPATTGSSRFRSRPTRKRPIITSGGSGATPRGPGWSRSTTAPGTGGSSSSGSSELSDHGTIVLKFWLQISKDEQLRRFRDREATDYKRHKINAEDWRNRRKWAAYEIAVGDMLALTHSHCAPWHLIAANNKRFARLEIIKASCKQIEAALEADK
jgi:hypothetical protein